MVVGGGDSAMEEANFLTRFGREVALVHRRDAFRASKIMLERARANPKIEFVMNTAVEEVYDVKQNIVTGVRLRNLVTGETWDARSRRAVSSRSATSRTRRFSKASSISIPMAICFRTAARAPTFPACSMPATCRIASIARPSPPPGAGCMAAIEAERMLEAEGH